MNGCFNEMASLNGMPGIETTEFLLSKIDDFGTPKAYNHYAVGWAHALCAPYQWTKQVASHWGGTRNGTIVHWPNGLDDKGGPAQPVPPRHRHSPHDFGGGWSTCPGGGEQHRQAPLEGVSMLATLRDGNAAGDAPRPVLRDVRQPRDLSPRMDRGNQAPHAVGDRNTAAPSTTTYGNCTDPTTGPRPTTSSARTRRNSPNCNVSG